jgi:predicted transcriptional regulator
MSDEEDVISKKSLLAHTSNIAAAYFANHDVKQDDISNVLETIYAGLVSATQDKTEALNQDPLEPAVPIEESLTEDVIICLEDGLPFQSLKRHLRVKYDMTPEAYRKKWGLPIDYPMVAPAYAKRRSELAKRTGLGKNRP